LNLPFSAILGECSRPPVGWPAERKLYHLGAWPCEPPMSTTSISRRRFLSSLVMVMMFLFADLMLPSALPQWPEQLEPDHSVSYSSMTYNITSTTGINSSDTMTNYESAETFNLGPNQMGEGRILMRVANSFNTSDTIHSAVLELTCGKDPLISGGIAIYAARMVNNNWDLYNATWSQSNTGSNWGMPGADGSNDRGAWEPQVNGYGNATFQINITAIYQYYQSSSSSDFSFLLAGEGTGYDCHMSNSTILNSKPRVLIDYTSNTSMTAGGTLSPDFIEDGKALMANTNFIINAATNPQLTWENLSGRDVQVQLSLNEEFKSINDDTWFYTSQDNATMFTMMTSTGSMVIPSGDDLGNGSTMFYRMRAVDSGDIIGDWESGYFHLPSHSVTDNGDNTATFSFDFDDLGLTEDSIEDTFIDSSSSTRNTNMGDGNSLTIGTSPSSEQYGLMRFMMDDVGLHEDSAIISATLNLNRDSNSGNANVSIHMMETGVWTEDGVTWRRSDGSTSWADGGREASMSVGSFVGSAGSSLFEVNITSAIQHWLDQYNAGSPDQSLDLMMVASTMGWSQASTDSVNFNTTESGANGPSLQITYRIGSGNSPSTAVQLSPDDGAGVWNMTGYNLSANTTPELFWDAAVAGSNDMILEISQDEEFRNIAYEFDTAVNNDFAPSDGSWMPTFGDSLAAGYNYHWRIAHRDSYDQLSWWNSSSFLVASTISDDIGNNESQIRMRHGNATVNGDSPECGDTYIDSASTTTNYNGEDLLQVSYNTFGSEASVLIGCDLVSHQLPTGFAVKNATLKIQLYAAPSGTPTVGIWDSSQHNWSEDSATWNAFDGTNAWGTAGAKGWERGNLLDTEAFGSSWASGDWAEFDITIAVQKAMREGRNVDLMLGIIGAGTGNNREVLFTPNNANSANRAEISYVYVQGSDAVPDDPVPTSPLNGSWSVENGIEVAPEQSPVIGWGFSANNVSVGGWAIQFDTASSFDTADLRSATSWTNIGFDVTNMTYSMGTQLTVGETWYWRVRATSTTNQIGNWSTANHFMIPDLITWNLSSTSSGYELHHRDAMPDLNLPNFLDTFVVDGGSLLNQTQFSSSSMTVGTSNGVNYTAMMKIPLDQLPTPQNAHVSKAILNVYGAFGSDTDQMISVHQNNLAWNESATGMYYDGNSSWNGTGARGAQDSGEIIDLAAAKSAGWMSFDITALVQQARSQGNSHVNLLFKGTDGIGLATMTTVEGTGSDHPWLNMTWVTGNSSSIPVAGSNLLPLNDSIQWDSTTHALLPATSPSIGFNHSNLSSLDAWRLYIQLDPDDIRKGWTIYDSRTSTTGWDLTNNTWQASGGFNDGVTVTWSVQAISGDILSPRSSPTRFHIPVETGVEINSTDAAITLQEGQLVSLLDYPTIFEDSTIDSGAGTSRFVNSANLAIGRSTVTSSTSFISSSLLKVDWSNLPIPGTHEIVDANITLTRLSGGENDQESITISVCEVMTPWNENVTWNSPSGNNATWNVRGGESLDDCDVPIDTSTIDYNSLNITFDITYAVQRAHLSGADTVDLKFRIESHTNDSWHFASSDYSTDETKRPALDLTWRTGSQWLPSQATGLMPVDADTIWNFSSSRPKGVDQVSHSFNSSVSNETRWVGQSSDDPRFLDSTTRNYDFSDLSTYNGTWDATNLTYTSESNLTYGDNWVYWRVRAEQDHRLGQWSSVNSYRVPGAYGFDDGAGNHTITIYDGSVFSESGSLPNVPDTTLDSSAPNASKGNSDYLDLGIAASGSGQASIMMTFDLGELPFPVAMTPTTTLLQLYRHNVTGTSSVTVSVHACDTFSQSSTTWNNPPSCSTSEVTRSTMLVVPPTGWVEWDITSLAQSNIANGNNTLSVMLQAVGTPAASSSFYSSDYFNDTHKPRLVLEYVDNVDGVVPPAQPSLIGPADGAILYNTSEWVLTSMDKPQLTWNAVANATGYILTVSDIDGVQKYRSWIDTEINGTTFTFSDNLSTGQVYEWWVQAINGSIPGPSSARRAFALGNSQSNVDNGDNTWTYNFQTGNEVGDLGHTNVRDSYLGSGNANTNHGSDDLLVGTDCEGALTECRMIIGVNNAQVPLPPNANIHSASLRLSVSDQGFNGGTMITFSVHRLLTGAWSQSGSTWNSSSAGNAWSIGGMAAGTEYDPVAISSMTTTAGVSKIWLDLGHDLMSISSDNQWIIIGTSAAGTTAWMEFYSSEASSSVRPLLMLNYTTANKVNVSPNGSTTDADSMVQFSHTLEDYSGGFLSGDVEWSSSNGVIDSSGLFTPSSTGLIYVKACFGVICETVNLTVTPGTPTILVSPDTSATITADDFYTITAEVQDQHGNTVPGQTITFTPTNGTMNGSTFEPYSFGAQTISIGWNGQIINVNIVVTGGVPTHYTTTGCDQVIKAGTTCSLTWTLHDQHGNILDMALGGGLSWNATGGAFSESNGTFFAMTVGQYNLTMISTGGISHIINIEIDHGAIDYLEINVSSQDITADDIVYLNTTRVDIMGNRFSVELPLSNWTVNDGLMVAGQPALWHAQTRGTKTISAQYAGTSTEIDIQVSSGAITGLVLVIDSVESTWTIQNLTSDDDLTVKVKAHDSDGNRWTENVNWRIEHAMFNDQSVLQGMTYGSTTLFVPTHSSTSAYTLFAQFDGGNFSIEVSLNITVSEGDLTTVTLLQPSVLDQNLNADQGLAFTAQLFDQDGNPIAVEILSYRLTDVDSGETTDITSQIVDAGGIWQASTAGNWSITAWANNDEGYEIAETVTIAVSHGDAVSVSHEVIANSAVAGDEYTLTIIGEDEDGNSFLQSVLWSNQGKPVPTSTIEGQDGIYNWSASVAGTHTFTYRAPSGATADWSVEVNPHTSVNTIILHVLSEKALQDTKFEIWVQTYDEWNNEIPVPVNTEIKLTGRMVATKLNTSNWEILTLDEGPQIITVSVHGASADGEITVDGTFMGFFKSGGPLYYAGAGLGLLIVLVVFVVIILVLRSGSDEWDEDEEDEDEDYAEETDAYDGGYDGGYDDGPSTGPGGPPPTETAPAEDTSWMVEQRVDDDGCEWAEDENGIWWYRDQGVTEWAEWVD